MPVTLQKKQCGSCEQWKPLEDFHRNKCGKHGRATWCKSCMSGYAKDWRLRDPETRKRSERSSRVKRYGISLEQYEEMLAAQDGVCAICGGPETTVVNGKPRHLVVDHCHETGAVRGLLCDPCNRAVGSMKDDPARLEAAAVYLRKATC